MTDRAACNVCRQCNHKGRPSVMRGSMYCDTHYRFRKREGFFKRLFTKVRDNLFDRRLNQETKEINTKGFREDWFYR